MIKNVVVTLAALLMAAGVALASQMTPVSPYAGYTGSGLVGSAPGNHSPIVRKTQYYGCRAECSYCRDDCYQAYRVNCFSAGCREQFVLCMRACWYDICRGC